MSPEAAEMQDGIVLWERPRCPQCGRFTADVIVQYSGFAGEIERVVGIRGTCSAHGVVEVNPQYSWAGE